MAQQNFQNRTIASFSVMRDDMDTFRESMNEWIIFLDEAVKEQRGTIRELTERVEEMEARIRVGL